MGDKPNISGILSEQISINSLGCEIIYYLSFGKLQREHPVGLKGFN